MATYTVTISGATHNSYGYVTINGSKTTATGTTTYTSKPTISVYVGASSTVSRRYSTVTLNGEVVREGYGSYNLDFGDADTININISTATYNSNIYRNADITTETSSGGGGSGGGGSGGGGHSANVSGTAYEIEGGTVLIGGVSREIESGLVLTGGVSREIEFAKKLIMTITGSGNSSNCYVRVGGSSGTKYYNAATVEIEPGTSLYCYVSGSSGMEIYLNGTVVGTQASSRITYTHTANANLTVEMTYDPRGRAFIKITEE